MTNFCNLSGQSYLEGVLRCKKQFPGNFSLDVRPASLFFLTNPDLHSLLSAHTR